MTNETPEKPKIAALHGTKAATVYHVTPGFNLLSISRQGVDPAFSQGKMKRSYWVIGALVQWALLHCSNRKSIPVSALRVCVAQIPLNALINTNMPGVYQVKLPVFISNFDDPSMYFERDLLYGTRER